MAKRRLLTLLIALLSLTLTGCDGVHSTTSFEYADLRLLDPAEAWDPATDIIALYVKVQDHVVGLRLDILDLTSLDDFDLYLALDTIPGGTTCLPLNGETDLAWDLLLSFQAATNPEVLSTKLRPIPSLMPQISYQPQMDIVTILLPMIAIPSPGPFHLQVFTTLPGSKVIADSLNPVASNAPPPPRASLLLAFWNTFPAYTPAQSLRLWSGAHAGPGGERSGLYYLLEAVAETKIPVTLLDVKSPESLAGLDYLGHLPRIQDLHREGLLDLPDALPIGFPVATQPGWVTIRAAHSTRSQALAYGMPTSQILAFTVKPIGPTVIPDLELSPYKAVFAPLQTDATADTNLHLFHTNHMTVIPLPETDLHRSAGHDGGLALDWRRTLLEQALDPNPSLLTILGGDLQMTLWTDATRGQGNLHWIAAHPWIEPLTPSELITRNFPTRPLPMLPPPSFPSIADHVPYISGGQPIPSGLTVSQLQEQVLEAFTQAPSGALTESAWRAYLAAVANQTCGILDPEAPSHAWSGCEGEYIHPLTLLRVNYIGRTGIPLAAARWGHSVAASDEPETPRVYRTDLNWDGVDEFVYSNRWLFAVITMDGGRLAWLGGYDPQQGPIQLIGSRSQFVIGLSDPSTWDPLSGEIGERSIPLLDGAFNMNPKAGVDYQVTSLPDGLVFAHPDGSPSVRYSLNGRQLHISMVYPGQSLAFEAPIVLMPEVMAAPEWFDLYTFTTLESGYRWGIKGGPALSITSSTTLQLDSFLDSPARVMTAEDPNLDYPPGHYLPFPMALITGSGISNAEIDLIFESSPVWIYQ